MKRHLDGIYEGAPELEMYLAGGAGRRAQVACLCYRRTAGQGDSGTEGSEWLWSN